MQIIILHLYTVKFRKNINININLDSRNYAKTGKEESSNVNQCILSMQHDYMHVLVLL